MAQTLCISFLFCLFNLSMFSQAGEAMVIQRNMSLGEKQGYKVILPHQTVEQTETLTKELIKEHKGILESTSNSFREMSFKNLIIPSLPLPLNLYVHIEKEGKNVGWKGYYFFSDSTTPKDTSSLKDFSHKIYKKSMWAIYEDSIFFQNKTIKESEKKRKDITKEKERNEEKILKNNNKIEDLEKEISSNETSIEKLQSKTPSINSSIKIAEKEYSEAEKELEEVEKLNSQIKDAESKRKKLLKKLEDLEKNPSLNAGNIDKMNYEIRILDQSIPQTNTSYQLRIEPARLKVKNAEKTVEKAKNAQKDNEREIKSAQKQIEKNKDKILDIKKESEMLKKAIEYYESTERPTIDNEIMKNKSSLDVLQKTQSQYKL